MLQPIDPRVPNNFLLLLLQAVEDVLGEARAKTVLTTAGLEQYRLFYPVENLEKEIPFAHITAINVALDAELGSRIGRTKATQIGEQYFSRFLDSYASLSGIADLAQKVMVVEEKIGILLPALAGVIGQYSDQSSRIITDGTENLIFTLETCPYCWQQRARRPVCHIMHGFLSEAIRWATNGQRLQIEMVDCQATGGVFGKITVDRRPQR